MSAATPGDRPELGDELRRGREVVRDLLDRDSPRASSSGASVGVAAGALGLGERAVRDLADELRLEVELVVRR